MKRFLYILLLLVIGLQIGCRSTDDSAQYNEPCSFNLSVASYDGQPTKADLQQISALKAGIYDASGNLVQRYLDIRYSSDLKQVNVEGLRDGNYTIAFFAIGELRQQVALEVPPTLGDQWIPQSPTTNVDYNEYLATTIPFEIRNGTCEAKSGTLRHVVSKISVNVDFSYPNWPGGVVKSFTLEFPDGTFASNHALIGGYSGADKQSFQLGENLRDIYLLPTTTTGKVKGRAVILGTYSDGRECRAEKEFAIAVEPNKRSTINITFEQTDADNLGLIRYYDSQRKLQKSRKVWQDGCNNMEYLDGKAFYPTKPIALTLDAAKKELTVTFYGGLNLKDVTVMVKRPNDMEFFELAWFETIAPFEERKVSFVENIGPKLYRTESGKLAMFDGLRTLDGVQIKYKSEDPFIKKIQTITWPGYLTFDAGQPEYLKQPFPASKIKSIRVAALYVREAMALLTNTGYILSSQGWKERMLQSEAEGPFYNDAAKTPISFANVIFPRIMQSKNLNLSILNPNYDYTLQGVANIGNGDYISLREFVVIEHYTSSDRANTFYHEFMHTCGYGHDGNLTYGKFCDQAPQYHVSKLAELPYYSASILHSWDNPNRFR